MSAPDRLIGADIMGDDLWGKWIDAREKCTDENAQEVLVGLLNIIDQYLRENERLRDAINQTLDAVSKYPEHPMTASEVILRQAVLGQRNKDSSLLAVDLDSGIAITESGVYQPTQNSAKVLCRKCDQEIFYIDQHEGGCPTRASDNP